MKVMLMQFAENLREGIRNSPGGAFDERVAILEEIIEALENAARKTYRRSYAGKRNRDLGERNARKIETYFRNNPDHDYQQAGRALKLSPLTVGRHVRNKEIGG